MLNKSENSTRTTRKKTRKFLLAIFPELDKKKKKIPVKGGVGFHNVNQFRTERQFTVALKFATIWFIFLKEGSQLSDRDMRTQQRPNHFLESSL